jgi:hypothetical protein
MQNVNSKGSGLISLIIALAIVLALVFGFRFMGRSGDKNQIQSGRDAVDAAKDAANVQNERSQQLQNDLDE